MAEYGVVLAVITLAVIGAITLLSDNVRSAIESVASIPARLAAQFRGTAPSPEGAGSIPEPAPDKQKSPV